MSRVPAAGFVHRGGMLRCVVSFDPETFAEIRARAEREGTSFAEQVRRLVEWQLDEETAA